MPRLSLSFFGAFQAELAGKPILHFRSANVQGLLVYLAMQAKRPFPRDTLATLFWADLPDSTARKNLRQTLYQLRQLLDNGDGEPFLLVTRHTVQWNEASDYQLDVAQFEAAVAVEEWQTAVSLAHAPLLPGFFGDSEPFEAWLRLEQERLHRLILDALYAAAEQAFTTPDFATARQLVRRQLALEPWREKAHRQLMQVLLAVGERSAALAQYDTCVATLQEELGVAPSAETTALYEAIVAGKLAPPPEEKRLPEKTAVSPPLAPSPTPDRAAEQVLLQKVNRFWVEGVLQRALADGQQLDVTLETVPGAVANPWQGMVATPDEQPALLPAGVSIAEIFAANGRSLLILGGPGAGKTVLLLRLAQSLLAAAQTDAAQPLPVVFNLASWGNAERPLADWLVAELNEKYLIPRRMGQRWVETGRLALLLDGLDEVAPPKQAACVAAINAFRQENGLEAMALCCRQQAYTAIGVGLRLGGAVGLRPLTSSQATIWLRQLGGVAHELQEAIAQDPLLQEMAQSPLMLQVMSKTLSARDFPDGKLLPAVAGQQRKERLLHTIFASYVGQMTQQMVAASRYLPEAVPHWLGWLARGLTANNQTLFLVEGLQPGWLTSRRQRWGYMLLTRLFMGLFVGLVLWLFGLVGPQVGIHDHSRSSLLIVARWGLPLMLVDFVMSLLLHMGYGLAVVMVDTVFFERRWGQERPFSHWDWGRKTAVCLTVALLALVQLLLFGEQTVLLLLQITGSTVLFFIVSHFAFGQGYGNDVGRVEALRWSWQASLRGVVPALPVGFSFSLILWQLFVTTVTLGQVLWLLGLPIALLVVVLSGLTSRYLETRAWPNQGIWLSGRNALLGGSIAAAVIALVTALVRLLLGWQGIAVGSLFSMYAGLVVFFLAALVFGGFNVINHLLLRLILWWSGELPQPLAPFLNAATRHVLLYRVGGGYMFIHRLLQEHLAATTQTAVLPPTNDLQHYAPDPSAPQVVANV